MIIDLSRAHVWDTSAVAALDAVETHYRRDGATVSIVGMNPGSEWLHERSRGRSRRPTSRRRRPHPYAHPMAEAPTQDQVIEAARSVGSEFTREDVAKKLGVEVSEMRPSWKALKESNQLKKVREDDGNALLLLRRPNGRPITEVSPDPVRWSGVSRSISDRGRLEARRRPRRFSTPHLKPAEQRHRPAGLDRRSQRDSRRQLRPRRAPSDQGDRRDRGRPGSKRAEPHLLSARRRAPAKTGTLATGDDTQRTCSRSWLRPSHCG